MLLPLIGFLQLLQENKDTHEGFTFLFSAFEDEREMKDLDAFKNLFLLHQDIMKDVDHLVTENGLELNC